MSQQRYECHGKLEEGLDRVRASPPCADVRDADDWFGHREFIFLQFCRLLLQINSQNLKRVHAVSQVCSFFAQRAPSCRIIPQLFLFSVRGS